MSARCRESESRGWIPGGVRSSVVFRPCAAEAMGGAPTSANSISHTSTRFVALNGPITCPRPRLMASLRRYHRRPFRALHAAADPPPADRHAWRQCDASSDSPVCQIEHPQDSRCRRFGKAAERTLGREHDSVYPMGMGSLAHGMPEKAHAASGAAYEKTQANEGRNCERKSGQQYPGTDRAPDVDAP